MQFKIDEAIKSSKNSLDTIIVIMKIIQESIESKQIETIPENVVNQVIQIVSTDQNLKVDQHSHDMINQIKTFLTFAQKLGVIVPTNSSFQVLDIALKIIEQSECKEVEVRIFNILMSEIDFYIK